MRVRLTALALAATAAATFSPAAGAASGYERQCSGVVDTHCFSEFCGIADCTRRDCVVYSGVVGDYNTPFCVGRTPPRGGGSA